MTEDTIHISGLEPLLEPGKVAGWPPAPGWYLVIALALLALLYLGIRLIRKRRKNRYRTMALAELKNIRDLQGHPPAQKDLRALNHLIKVTALTAYPRDQVAPLSGRKWEEFLLNSCPSSRSVTLPEGMLDRQTLRKPGHEEILTDDWVNLTMFCEQWIRHHKA